jgi:ribosomal-protein-alanine N-acetyltransferase
MHRQLSHESDVRGSVLKPPEPFQIQPMRLSDIDAVLEIDRVSFPTPSKARLFQYELTHNTLAHYQVLTVLESGLSQKLIGYSGYWMMGGELHISTLAVCPSWRGRGLGEILLLNVLFMANEQAAQLATLEVRHSNLVAQALYRKYNFEVVGVRRRYYSDNDEDAVLMTVSPFDALHFLGLEQKREALYSRLRSEV